MIWLLILICVVVLLIVLWFFQHQRRLRQRAWLMREAIRNHDFSFRLPTKRLPCGERAMQQLLNDMGQEIRSLITQNEVDSWQRLTRVLTHEMMNATAPITSISQSLLSRPDVKGTPLEEGIKAIHETSCHLSDFVANYRKLSELEKPVLSAVGLRKLIDDVRRTYPDLSWQIEVSSDTLVKADAGMLRQVMMNLVKNAVEAGAKNMLVEVVEDTDRLSDGSSRLLYLYIGNDGIPIPAENRQSLFVPFFTTKRSGNGIGLSLSRRMMIQQGGMMDLVEPPRCGCHVAFLLSIPLCQ